MKDQLSEISGEKAVEEDKEIFSKPDTNMSKTYNPHMEDIYMRLFKLVGVRPVDYGFGFMQSNNLSTITFDEAMEHIVTFLENDDVIAVGDSVVFTTNDDWITFGSRGVVISHATYNNFSSFEVDFNTGSAAGRRVTCSEFNLEKVPKMKVAK